MSKPYCEICKCKIPSESLIKSHKEGKKHLQWKALKKAHEKTQQCSVFVRDFPKTDDIASALLSYFSDFGKVDDIYIDKEKCSYAFVEFANRSTVDDLLQKSKDDLPPFKGQLLTIKQRLVKDWSPPNRTVKIRRNAQSKASPDIGILDIVKSKELKTKLDDINDVNRQLLCISSTVSATNEEKEMCMLVCKLLEEVFVELYPDSKIVAFGSTATDYSSRASDLDLSLLSDLLPENPKYSNPIYNKNRDTTKDDEIERKMKDEFDFICKSLRRCVPGIEILRCITNAHCPVIKLRHSVSKLQIDLTVNNRLSAKNTELLNAYSKCNGAVKHIVQLVRLWSKAKGLSGYKSTTISSYALTLMVIHYLQNCELLHIPVLQDGKPDLSPTNSQLIQGWDCTIKPIEISDIDEELIHYADILLGFFDYYLSFDFVTNAVTIRSNSNQSITTIEEELLKTFDIEALPSGFKSPLVIQDPFELSRNVTYTVTKQALDKFHDEWILARDIIQRTIDEQPGSIINLFTLKTPDEKPKKLTYDFQIAAAHCQSDIGNVQMVIKDMIEKNFSMQCEWQDAKAESDTSPPLKRRRTTDSSARVLEVTALRNTWTKQRQLRRLQKMKQEAGKEELSSTAPSNSLQISEPETTNDSCSVGSIDRDNLSDNEIKPILIMKITIDVSGKIILKTHYAKTLNVVQSFYAIFKKLCIGRFG